MAFLAVFWSVRVVYCCVAGIFFACYGWWWWWCGGAEGIGGMGRNSHWQPVLHPSHTGHTTIHRGWRIVFYHSVRVFVMDIAKPFYTARCFLKEQSVNGHVVRFKNFVDKENRKTCGFTFQNIYFQIADIAKHVLWHRILYWEWEEDTCPVNCQNSYGFVAPPVV